jgi:CarD family transcriptional regulator
MFNVFDLVVYPGYGVARVSREVVKEINGNSLLFYELKFLNKDVTILVPCEGINSVGVRPLSSRDDLMKIFDIFCTEYSDDWFFNITLISWNRRNKDYQNRIRKGMFLDLALIYRDLKYIEKLKGLSFGEKSILNQVDALVSEECAVIQERPVEVVSKELNLCCIECITGNSHLLANFLSFDIHINNGSASIHD